MCPPTTSKDDSTHNDDVEKQNLIETKTIVPPPSSSSWNSLVSCLFYSFCSVTMILTNKSLASSFHQYLPTVTAADGTTTTADVNLLILCFQAAVAVIGLRISVMVGWLPPDTCHAPRSMLVSWLPVNLLFCAMLYTGLAALQHAAVPVVTVFKNVTNLGTALGETVLYNNPPECLAWLALAILVSGAVAAVGTDVNVSMTATVWMASNCIVSSAYVLYMKHFCRSHAQLSKFSMVYVNNLLLLVLLGPCALVSGQVHLLMYETELLHNAAYAACNIWAGLVGLLLNYAALRCVAAAGPVTYGLTGSLNKIPVAVLGYFLFETATSPGNVFFLSVSLAGGFLYTYAKIRTSSRLAKKQVN